MVPVFINCRDRVEPLARLVAWLESAGHDEIYLLDNDSAYPPLLQFYETTPHRVVRLHENYGRLALWAAPKAAALLDGRPYVYTDPDVVPDPCCPPDAIAHFQDLLDRFPLAHKVGFGLRIDNLPSCYRHREAVIDWESQLWEEPLGEGLFHANIDTTFALYRGGSAFAFGPAIRTGAPYVARHEPWYADSANPTEEDAHYVSRAATHTAHSPATSHWDSGALPSHLADAIAERRARMALPGANSTTLPQAPDSGWRAEPDTVDEAAFTPWAKPGWSSWNAMSPEQDFCEFVGFLTRLLRPRLVLETGVGQGFTTRRIAATLCPGQRYIGFESETYYRLLLSSERLFKRPDICVDAEATPSEEQFASADLVILDSDDELRHVELERWATHARPGAIAVIHDTGNGHPTNTLHRRLRLQIDNLGLAGFDLRNPRGAYVAIAGMTTRRELADVQADAAERLAALQASEDHAVHRAADAEAALAVAIAELEELRATRIFRYSAPARLLWGRFRR